jgi:hypothetical protein
MNENLPSLLPTNSDFQVLQVIAQNASRSGLYAGVGSEQKILMVLLAAQELGIKPLMALNGGLWNIQGKIEISARLMSSMIRRAGHSIGIIQCDSKACILEGKRKDNGDTFRSQFTIEDAAKAGLSNRDVWKKFTEDMLYNRALSRLARRLFADVIGTSYVEGEIRDAEFELVESKPSEPVIDPLVEEVDKMKELMSKFEESDRQRLFDYVTEVSKAYKKTPMQIMEAAEANFSKFTENFNVWKSKITQPPE